MCKKIELPLTITLSDDIVDYINEALLIGDLNQTISAIVSNCIGKLIREKKEASELMNQHVWRTIQ